MTMRWSCSLANTYGHKRAVKMSENDSPYSAS